HGRMARHADVVRHAGRCLAGARASQRVRCCCRRGRLGDHRPRQPSPRAPAASGRAQRHGELSSSAEIARDQVLMERIAATPTPAEEDDSIPKLWEVRTITKAGWKKHREHLLSRSSPGTRPEGWWLYEKKQTEAPPP